MADRDEIQLLGDRDHCLRMIDKLAAEVRALRAERDAWKDAIIDACVVDWILVKEHESNPQKAVNDLLCWQVKIALDPAVSKEAHALHARAKAAEAALARVRAAAHTVIQNSATVRIKHSADPDPFDEPWYAVTQRELDALEAVLAALDAPEK